MSHSRWLALGLLTLALTSTWLAAQPPRKEEEEEPPAKEKERARPVVPVPVEPEKKGPETAPPVAPDPVDPDVGTFKEEAAKTINADAKEMFRSLVIPFDRIEPNFKGGLKYRIELLPERDLPEGEFTVKVLDGALKNSIDKKIATGTGFKYTPFELIVLETVAQYLEKDAISRTDQLDFAARAVASGLRWHLNARDTNKRLGKGWDPVTRQLKDRLLGLQQERFDVLIAEKKYDQADELGLKMLTRNPDNVEVTRAVYRLNLIRVDKGLKAPTDADLLKLRDSLLAYERIPGKKDETLIGNTRRRLRNRATELVNEAKRLDKQPRAAEALAKLRQAETLDPDAPGIEDVRVRLRGTVLYVGVPKLPEKMSPVTAVTDAEKWAVELMFEGLLESVPDTEVIRYRPALAESLPAIMPLGRSFTLPRNAHWSRDPGDMVNALDVQGTLALLNRPALKATWEAERIDVFEEVDRIDDPFHLRLAYKKGVLEPLGRATFKVIPARYLMDLGKAADDPDFAKAPFGSGPFKYEGREREGVDRECAVFRANPFYTQRNGKLGLPWIRELRMYVPSQSSLAADVAAGQLHICPDVPGDLATRFRGDEGLKDVMRVRSAQTNRRVHILAINHKNTNLQNDKVRQGLSAAINRDAILKEVFRSAELKAHAALTGPFPVGCWATPKGGAALSKIGGGGLIKEGLNNHSVRMKLTYEKDDKNKAVAQLMKTQIEQATADNGGQPLLAVDLVELTPLVFREKVYLEHDYDLALTTFDYRDDLYSLSGLLDPEAIGPEGRGGRNFLSYLASGTNPTDPDRRLRRLIEDAGKSRNFSAIVRQKTWDIHALFNQRMPFVPLWQLDRFMVVHKDLEMYFDPQEAVAGAEQLNPATVFTGVEMWRLK
ncbi:MAG TPA: ABC transporter substrate-binding protein [Gemmataceae bacterium]|jgi:ABC-type transport system substrate-binding protein|nr:ABC transporter substrate-binding protein [Gemmataceae bacterium]